MGRLRSKAKENLQTNEFRIRKWWVDKYKRPTNDPLFMQRSWAEWQIEMFEDMWLQRDQLMESMNNGDMEIKVALPAITALNKVLDDGDIITGDPLIDKWEKEWAEGKTPDLNEVL